MVSVVGKTFAVIGLWESKGWNMYEYCTKICYAPRSLFLGVKKYKQGKFQLNYNTLIKTFCIIRGLMVAKVGFKYRDRGSIPTVCQIMDDNLRQVVYIVS